MRTISLWEPWASAVAIRAKRYETRHWSTDYRGPLAIHAAKRLNKSELRDLSADSCWRGALSALGFSPAGYGSIEQYLTFGAIVAVCDLVDCKPTESLSAAELDERRLPTGVTNPAFAWRERDMGDFYPGRFACKLENVRRIQPAIPWKGAQGFFDVPDDVLSQQIKPVRVVTLFDLEVV